MESRVDAKHSVFIIISLLALLLLAVIGFMTWVGWQVGSVAPATTALQKATVVRPDPLVSPAGPIVPPIETLDPIRGNPNAAVTIIYFGDFRCAHCAEMSKVWEQVFAEYGDLVRLVWKDYTLGQGSLVYHKGARCAQVQGAFWQMYDAIYASEVGPSTESLTQYAQSIGLDAEAYTSCLASQQIELVVYSSAEQSYAAGIEAAPSYFINDVFVEGQATYEEVAQIIEEQL